MLDDLIRENRQLRDRREHDAELYSRAVNRALVLEIRLMHAESVATNAVRVLFEIEDYLRRNPQCGAWAWDRAHGFLGRADVRAILADLGIAQPSGEDPGGG